MRRLPGGRGGVERTVFEKYARYPSLYGRSPWSRWHIFDHLFFVVGNGFEWQSGQLRTTLAAERRGAVRIRTAEDELARLNDWRVRNGIVPLQPRSPAQELAEIEASWQRFDRMPEAFAPISGYSAIAVVPDDVHPDWLAAVRDAVRMLDLLPATYRDPEGNRIWAEQLRRDLTRRG